MVERLWTEQCFMQNRNYKETDNYIRKETEKEEKCCGEFNTTRAHWNRANQVERMYNLFNEFPWMNNTAKSSREYKRWKINYSNKLWSFMSDYILMGHNIWDVLLRKAFISIHWKSGNLNRKLTSFRNCSLFFFVIQFVFVISENFFPVS